ncbi:MAG: aquaporin [Gemmatimonadaceae bacterium]|nr:aquaporin [Gemmatimonadaceae bacterium]
MRDSIRHFLAEFIGTFALTFVGSAAIMQATQSGGNLVAVALAHGLVLAVFVSAFMHIGAHFNPAVTIGMLVVRRIEPVMAGLYVVAQVAGATAAAFTLKFAFPAALFAATRAGGQQISLDITSAQAFTLEMVATMLIVWVIFGTAIDHRAPRIGGFGYGLAMTVVYLAIGNLTGASVNPARSFGPAFASGIYEAQGIYWLAPITGAILAALIYEKLLLTDEPEPADHGALGSQP